MAHTITVTPADKHVQVTLAGATIADSRAALALQEAAYPVVYYVPMADVDMTRLTRTATRTHCPYKGDASYWTIAVDGREARDAVWGYETPKPEVAAIANHVAFYPNRVDAFEVS